MSLRVLLAEDNPVNQDIAARMLRRRGHTVTVADNGRRAVELALSQPFDLIFMDVQMPELDGLAAAAEIRAHECKQAPAGGGSGLASTIRDATTSGPASRRRIVAMTAHAMAGDRERCLGAGMDDYMSKPIQREELQRVLDAALQAAPRLAGAPAVVAAEPADAPQPSKHAPSPAPPSADAQGAPALDLAKLLDNCDSDAGLMDELLALFVKNLPAQISAVHAAIARADDHGLDRAAHKLKGSLASVFARAASAHAAELELVGRAGGLVGQSCTARARAALRQLETELARVEQQLTARQHCAR